MRSSLAVQSTVREAIAADLSGAVERLAAIGITKVEPYGFVERANEHAQAFPTAGVTAPSGHAAVIDAADPARTFAQAAKLDIGAVIDPFIPTERWRTADDARRLAERVRRARRHRRRRRRQVRVPRSQLGVPEPRGRPAPCLRSSWRSSPVRSSWRSMRSGRRSEEWTLPRCCVRSATEFYSCVEGWTRDGLYCHRAAQQ
jgi:hypothetical protein